MNETALIFGIVNSFFGLLGRALKGDREAVDAVKHVTPPELQTTLERKAAEAEARERFGNG